MRTDQILILFVICLSLVFMGEWLLISEADEMTEREKGAETQESSSQDSIVEKFVLPLRLTAIISTTATAVVWSKYSRMHKDYMDAKEVNKISEYYDRSNKYYKLRNGLLVTTGLLWGANLVVLWLKPPMEKEDEFASVLETEKISNIASTRWRIHLENGLALSWSERF